VLWSDKLRLNKDENLNTITLKIDVDDTLIRIFVEDD